MEINASSTHHALAHSCCRSWQCPHRWTPYTRTGQRPGSLRSEWSESCRSSLSPRGQTAGGLQSYATRSPAVVCGRGRESGCGLMIQSYRFYELLEGEFAEISKYQSNFIEFGIFKKNSRTKFAQKQHSSNSRAAVDAPQLERLPLEHHRVLGRHPLQLRLVLRLD